MSLRFSKTITRQLLLATCLLLVGLSSAVYGDSMEIEVRGIDGALLENVEAQTRSFRITGNIRMSKRRLKNYREEMERRAAVALRPFGYYHASVRGSWNGQGESGRVLVLDIDRGEPVRVADYSVQITGPGASEPELQNWQADWPLTPERRLNQAIWEEQKNLALSIAEAQGYLNAAFSEQTIPLDLTKNRADLILTLETGPQAIMGTVS